jgi:hypothetical protein
MRSAAGLGNVIAETPKVDDITAAPQRRRAFNESRLETPASEPKCKGRSRNPDARNEYCLDRRHPSIQTNRCGFDHTRRLAAREESARWASRLPRASLCTTTVSLHVIHRKLKRKFRDSVSISGQRVGDAMPVKETKQQIEAELNASERDRVRAKYRELIADWDQFEARLRYA